MCASRQACRLPGQPRLVNPYSAVHVLLSKFYPDFILIFEKNLDKVGKNTLSRFYPKFIQIFLKLTLSKFYPYKIYKIEIKSG